MMDSDEDEALIEAEVQHQLKLLTKNGISQSNDYELEDNLDEVEMVSTEYAELSDDDDTMPASIQRYLNMVNKRSESLQKDLEECDNLLQDTLQGTDEFYYQSTEMKELAFILGEDPEELRDRVLTEVEDEECKESEHTRDHMIGHMTIPATDLIGEVVGITGSSPAQVEALHTTGDEITRALDSEQQAWQNVLQLDDKLKQQQRDMQQDTQHECLQQAARQQLKDQTRLAQRKQHADELQQMQQNRKAVEAKAEQELELQAQKTQEDLSKQQADIEKFAKDTEEERREFERHLAADRELKQRQRLHAATLIQAAVRSYRVRRKYSSRLNRLRDERHQRQLQNRQMEIVAVRRAKEQRKKREREEKMKKEEERRRREEEMQRREAEERQHQERLLRERIEHERKDREMFEKQRQEEENQRREQELKEEQALQERTQHILSKIQSEGSFPVLTDDKLTENEPTKTDAQEVFLTNPQEMQAASGHQSLDYEMVAHHEANSSAETAQIATSKDTSPIAAVDVIAGMDVLQHSYKTGSSRHSSPTPTLNLSASSGLAEQDNTEATCFQSATHQSVPSETADVNSDNKRSVLDSGTQGNSVQMVDDMGSTDDLHQDSTTSLTRAADIEARQVQWRQNSVSYRSVISGLSHSETRRPLRRVLGANKLPALTSSQLLAVSQPASPLSQVTEVVVDDSMPCSMSSLGSCPDLTCLHLRRCGIMLLEGLDQCSSITYIDLQHNKIEGIHCRDRTRLKQVMLQNNKLTSCHGLEGCTQLSYLQLSNNSITRTDGVESLVRLTHLDISHNQLVSISGIGQLVHLTHLNLSHNHLSSVQDLQTCCLLQSLNIESNSLVEMSPVQNQVLLNELRLNDNSISSLVPLSQAWLPLLQYASIAQNSLSDVPDMKYCVLLRRFDISHNCIADMDAVVNGLRECNQLEDLCLEGNPVTQDDQYRSTVLDTLRWLHVLDNEAVINPTSVPPTRTSLQRMCLAQLHDQEQLRTTYQQHTASLTGNSVGDMLQETQARDAYVQSSLELAIQHRYIHETGDVTYSQPDSSSSKLHVSTSYVHEQMSMPESLKRMDPPNVVSSGGFDSEDDPTELLQGHLSRTGHSLHSPSLGRQVPVGDSQMQSHDRDVVDDDAGTADSLPGMQRPSTDGNCWRVDDVMTRGRSAVNIPCNAVDHSVTSPASSSQAVNEAKKNCQPQDQRSHAAMVIQARWRGYVVRQDLHFHTKQYLAAQHIQALWRGYRVRQMVAVARQAVRYHDSEDEEDVMLYEVDPTSWDVARADVDSDWLPPQSPCIPRCHPPLPATKGPWSSHQALRQQGLPEAPRQAWYASPLPRHVNTPRDTATSAPHLSSKPPMPPVHASPVSDTPRSTKSSRQDQISEEWGFKDATTAELMMKRAKKLSKASSIHKKKTLDPLQKYKQVKRVHDSARVVPSPKRGTQRREFFQAREQEIQKATTAQRKEKEHKDARTLEWVHSHGGLGSDVVQEWDRHGRSEPNLPAITQNALQGRVQLMASPLLELQSVDGASSVSSMSHRPRSQSLSAHSHGELRLPAIKTNSAPSGRKRERTLPRGWTDER